MRKWGRGNHREQKVKQDEQSRMDPFMLRRNLQAPEKDMM